MTIMVRFMALTGMIAMALISFPCLRAPVFLHPVGDGDDNCRAGFSGNPASLHPHLAERSVEQIIGDDSKAVIPASTPEYVSFTGNEVGLQIESSDSSSPPLKIPPNFPRIYIRLFANTITAMQKIANVDLGAGKIRRPTIGRRMLAVPESKKDALNGLEDAALEPLSKAQLRRRRGQRRYLSDILGDSLAEYPRRVFVDVGPPGRAGGEGWFARQYPTRDLEFEIIRVDVDDLESSGGDGRSSVAAGGVTEWLRRNVREEEYVVMKAEADTVEEMVKERAIGLVDELFLECRNQWQKAHGGNKSRRAYWECLALYGKLRDEGVAVHQWWD